MENECKYKEYEVDPEVFSRERPVGVSGFLRFYHDCEDFLELCIDSCIDGLDELIVVYHDITDNAIQVLHKKQFQYPQKIKIYEYKPPILPLAMDWETFLSAKQLPYNSVHLFSGYSNYALSKVSYRYAVKIDVDQIYFSGYWKRLCDAYRSTKKVKLNKLEHLAFHLYGTYTRNFSKTTLFHRLMRRIAVLLYPFYFSYVEKTVINRKTAVSLSGINLFLHDAQWEVCLGKKGVKELYPLFNGAGDHCFFPLTSETFFDKWPTKGYYAGQLRILEVLQYKGDMLNAGFLWFHAKPLLISQENQIHKLYTKYRERFIPLNLLKSMPYRQFCKCFDPAFVPGLESIFSYFHNTQRCKIPWNILNRIERQYKETQKTRPYRKGDYYVEFYDELDKRICSFVEELATAGKLLLGLHSVSIPLQTYLFYKLCAERNSYNQFRMNGMTVDIAMKRIDALLGLFREKTPTLKKQKSDNIYIGIEGHPWYKLLNEYKGVLVVYIINARQLAYLFPLLKNMNGHILLLSEYDIPETTHLPDNIMALSLAFSKEKTIANSYLEQYFPTLFQYANTFEILLKILHPCGVVCLEGAHYQERLLAVMAETYDIPSYGIQQGWPSIMHSGFRRFPFRYFFTWGMGFNNLWSQHNPHPHFISAGYMYEILEQRQKEKTCISFFLQSPNFLSDSYYFESLLKLIPFVAQKYPNLTFLVREHPEYKLGAVLMDYWKHLPNIEIVSDFDLSKVYSRSCIVISHFSSSLMECLVHGCIPLVFDPTTHSRYNPDIEQEGLGLISSDENSFFNKLEAIIKGQFYQKPCHDIHYWFESIGNNAINNILNNISI